MFKEEAAWIRWVLGRQELPAGGRVADIGSSTLFARAVGQPYVEGQVLQPLRDRGLRITHVDAVQDPGVDVVADLADPATDLVGALGGPADLVLCLNVLQFVSELEPSLANVASAVAPGGLLLATTARKYRITRNPIDNRWRPTPAELLEALARHGQTRFEQLSAAELVIHDNEEYLPFTSRLTTTIHAGGRELRVPGGFDQLRRFGDDSRRWAQSCVLARRAA